MYVSDLQLNISVDICSSSVVMLYYQILPYRCIDV